MTDFKTALPVILVQLSSPGDQQANGALFHSHYAQGWLCFLIISLLTVSSWAISKSEIMDLQYCLRYLNKTIEKSDAMLYTPSIDNNIGSCRIWLLNCYILELTMVLRELEVDGPFANGIHALSYGLEIHNSGCQHCEEYALQNVTIFLDRLNDFLERMASELEGDM